MLSPNSHLFFEFYTVGSSAGSVLPSLFYLCCTFQDQHVFSKKLYAFNRKLLLGCTCLQSVGLVVPVIRIWGIHLPQCGICHPSCSTHTHTHTLIASEENLLMPTLIFLPHSSPYLVFLCSLLLIMLITVEARCWNEQALSAPLQRVWSLRKQGYLTMDYVIIDLQWQSPAAG